MNVAPKRVAKGMYWDKPWSLVDGCDPVSEGCLNCWSLACAKRFHRDGPVRFRIDRMRIPQERCKPTTYALWNDLFHPAVGEDLIMEAFARMGVWSKQHTFIVLTKRAERMPGLVHGAVRRWSAVNSFPNIILGVTAENQRWLDERVPFLLQTQAACRMISAEPLLGPLDIISSLDILVTINGEPEIPAVTPNRFLHWVVVGAESGPRRRECKIEWVRSIVEQCKAANVPVFVKQLHIGGKCVKDMSKFPEDLRIREFPDVPHYITWKAPD